MVSYFQINNYFFTTAKKALYSTLAGRLHAAQRTIALKVSVNRGGFNMSLAAV